MSALVQQSDEWLEWRRDKVGASDAPAIMGVSPWYTPYQLWAEKLQLTAPRQRTARQDRGLNLEDEARQEFERLLDTFVLPQVVVSSKYPWMIASLDGIDIDRKIVVEIKCPGQEDHFSALSGKIPAKYYPQLQHQLAVCELDMIYYFSYDGENGVVMDCYRDDSYIKNLITAEEIFWEQLQNLEPPALTDRDYQNRQDDLWCAAAGDYLLITSALRDLEKRQSQLKEQLIFMSQGKNSKGGGLQVTHVARRGSIDYSSIPELSSVDLEMHRGLPSKYAKISATK
jgi:putative phage-type endonuclease